MDVYRIGTLLEMVREIAAVLAQDGLRVKVCVQQALGQGFFTVSACSWPPHANPKIG
jgi:adenylate kinase